MTDGPHIYVTDDDPDIRDLIRELAEDQGFTCRTFDGGHDLLDAMDQGSKPAGMFLDLNMPGLDGIDVLKELGLRQTRCPIVIMSGHDVRTLSGSGRLAEHYKVNLLGTMQKPVMIDDLIGMLNRMRGRGSAITGADIEAAIKAGEIEPFYQPKIRVTPNEGPPAFEAVEALVRWRSPTRGMVSPLEFVGVAEESGAIGRLTETVLDRTAKDLAAWRAAGVKLSASVNLSRNLLGDLDIVDHYPGLVSGHGISPEDIRLEVTETGVMEDTTTALATLTRLRLKGFGLSIDDFGTGYSSLVQLYRLPFDELKIDRVFVADILKNSEAREIVHFLYDLGRRLDMDICVEGVESTAVFNEIVKLGPLTVQGYYFSEPIPADQILQFAQRFSPGRKASRAVRLVPGGKGGGA